MSDDIDAGPIDTGPAPSPSEPFPRVVEVPDGKSRDELVREQFNDGLKLVAHATEFAEDYARERQTQEQFLEGKDLSSAQMKEWHERTHSALQRAIDARAWARGEMPESQQQTPQSIPGYVQPDAPDYAEHFEAAKLRFSQYFDNPANIGEQNTAAEHKASVLAWLEAYDPRSELSGY